MKVLVIGGTGHVGAFLVPELIEQGHEVYIATRGNTAKKSFADYTKVNFITCDTKDPEDAKKLLNYGFEVVIDMPGSAYNVWNILKNDIRHLIACGSLWMFGNPRVIPTPEAPQNDCPFAVYAERFGYIQKMLEESGKYKAVFTAIMPPNISGPGKIPIDTMGGRSAEVHKNLMQGKPVILPEGPECIISPCDASDIAHLFVLAMNNPVAAGGEIFNVGSEYGFTVSQMVEVFEKIHGVKIPIERVTWEKYITEINPNQSAWWHFYAHMLPDITKAKTLLGYKPKFTPEEALTRAVDWMKQEGII